MLKQIDEVFDALTSSVFSDEISLSWTISNGGSIASSFRKSPFLDYPCELCNLRHWRLCKSWATGVDFIDLSFGFEQFAVGRSSLEVYRYSFMQEIKLDYATVTVKNIAPLIFWLFE